ncbi:acyltransferase [uncultured Formosa sp.]|uniref:acyltransferase n=1 Tax=uncultured Formosa sp. TaxID=255435 RepID=UPI002621CB34|nr:acyltransferase [uncultured Formosa sp.]
MNSFYSINELKDLGLKSFGTNVYISKYARIYNPENLIVGNHVRIDDFCILSGKITLGSHIHISAYCALYGKYGIVMKDFSGLSPRCTLFSASDDFNGDFLMSPMTKPIHNHIINGEIFLDKYSQIGANSTILPNAIVNEGAVAGAMSLITKNLDAWSVYAGIPVKKIKSRKQGLLKFIDEY